MLGMHKVLPQMRRNEVKRTTGFILLTAAVSPALVWAQSSGPGVVFSPAAGQYPMPMQVALSPAQPGTPGNIYYTTNGSDPHGVTFDAFNESVNTPIEAHIPDEGRSSALWTTHPSSFQGNRPDNTVFIDGARKAAKGVLNARAYIPVGANDVTLTAVVDAQGGTTEYSLQARVQTPASNTVFDEPSNTYYGMRINPHVNTVDVTRTVGNITQFVYGPFTVPLADAGPQQLSFSVSGRNPVELVGFKGSTRIFRVTDATPNRIQTGANAAMRFRLAQAVPTGEIASLQVVEKARTIAKPTRRYTQPITLTNSTLIRAYHRNGAASSAVAQAQYIRQ
jgi:hypothetical protein